MKSIRLLTWIVTWNESYDYWTLCPYKLLEHVRMPSEILVSQYYIDSVYQVYVGHAIFETNWYFGHTRGFEVHRRQNSQRALRLSTNSSYAASWKSFARMRAGL